MFVLSLTGAGLLPSLLYPKADGRNLGITVELAPGTTLASTQKAADELGEILRSRPYLESVVKFVGKKSPLSRNSIGEALVPYEDTNYIGFSCIFTRLEERGKMAFQYLEGLREEIVEALRSYPGSLLVLTPQTGGSTTEDPIQIEIVGEDTEKLREIVLQVQSALRAIPGASDVRDNLGPPRLDIKLVPKREALDFHRIDHEDLAYQVRFAMNTHRQSGLSVRESAARGAADRLRPIVSTTITTVAGLIPLSLSNPMWMPLCNAIIFGLISATFISQLVVPCLYLLLTRDRPLSPAEIA
ncbi:MAG: efflux RND transporter permease subunit [Pseudomonadota bacterium]